MAQERPGQGQPEPRRRTLRDRLFRRPQAPVIGPEAAQPVDGEARAGRRRSSAPLIVTGLAAVALAGGVIFHDDLGRFKDNLGQAKDNAGALISGIGKDGSKVATPTASAAAGSPTPGANEKPTPTPLPSPSGGAETQQNRDIPLVTFKSLQEVADRFGADDYSKVAVGPDGKPHWQLAENNTAAVLLPDNSDTNGFPLVNWGIEHRVKSAGGVIQGYDKLHLDATGIEQVNGNVVNNAQAQAEVVNPNVPEDNVMKATIRVPQNPADVDALYRKLLADQRALEVQQQPGTSTLPINECPPGEPARDVPVRTFKDTAEAASLFGADDYSKNPANWELKENNTAAVLKPDTSDPKHWGIEHKVRANGSVVQGYNKTKLDATGIEQVNGNVVNNAQAEAKVFNPSFKDDFDIMKGTFRIAVNSSDTEALFRKLEADQKALETQQQPGTLTLPVNECPIPGGKGATSSQAPSIKGGGEPAPTPSPTPTPIASIYQRA